MALIDVGITKEEVEASALPVPPAHYKMMYTGLLVDQVTKDIIWSTEKGGKMLKAKFQIVEHPDPKINGKQFIYNAAIGEFSFTDLEMSIPGFMVGSQVDNEAGIGTTVDVHVVMGKNTPRGDYSNKNNIKKIKRM